MLDCVKSFFKKCNVRSMRPDESGGDLNELHVATCAVLLEIAHADHEFSPAEEQRIMELMQSLFGLPREAVFDIRATAEERRHDSIDLWRFAQTIKEHFSAGEKEQLVEMIWRLIYADGHLDQHEDYLVHKLTRLLGVRHRQMINAKSRVLAERRSAPSGKPPGGSRS